MDKFDPITGGDAIVYHSLGIRGEEFRNQEFRGEGGCHGLDEYRGRGNCCARKTKRNKSGVEALIALMGMIPLNVVGRMGGGFVSREKTKRNE
jgi:hypothetical protein